MYEELVKRLREESEIERWLQPHSANETPKLLDDAAHAIEELSKERKTGKWVDMGDFEQCSACKGTHLKEFESYYGKVMWIKTPYCPYCGAKMIGGDDDA